LQRLKRCMATDRHRLRTGTKSTDKILEKSCPNRVKGEERPNTLPILDVTARSLKVWPPLINSHSFMQSLTNHNWKTVSSWLLTGLNLHEIMWINQKRSHFWAPCCNRYWFGNYEIARLALGSTLLQLIYPSGSLTSNLAKRRTKFESDKGRETFQGRWRPAL